MCTALHNFSFMNHQNQIRIFNGGQPVCHHNAGSAAGQLFRFWDGDIGDANKRGQSITLTADQARTVTAVFGTEAEAKMHWVYDTSDAKNPRIYDISADGRDVNWTFVVSGTADDLKIVYTPFHGTGYKLVPEILSTPKETLDAYRMAQHAGFRDINMDLIAGLPQDSLDGFKRSLDAVAALNPSNITVKVRRSAGNAFASCNSRRNSCSSVWSVSPSI